MTDERPLCCVCEVRPANVFRRWCSRCWHRSGLKVAELFDAWLRWRDRKRHKERQAERFAELCAAGRDSASRP